VVGGVGVMIIKNVDNKESNDKFIKAGLNAEKQMGHYLERAFAKSEDILILNDLRIQQDDNVAQIDHLVIHPYGFIIIESKSVSSKISVNKYGEWKRIYNKQEKGMPSPIQQAKRQASFLKDFLNEKATNVFRENIVNKLISKPTFNNYKFDILIAISDSGIIERDNISLPEVLKADTIPDNILNTISKRKLGALNIFSNDNYGFHKNTIKKIANVLLTLHKPVAKKIAEANTIQEKPIIYNNSQKSSIEHICPKCNNKNLEVAYGRNYYFKCLDCEQNIPIKHTCNTPDCKPRTKKRKLQFFKVCEACNIDELFWENKP
jgi:hypothetical protein